MRIAIVINTSWNIFNFRKGLVKAFLREGHEVIAIAPRDEYSDKLIEWGCEFLPLDMENKGTNPVKDFQLYRQLKQQYLKARADIFLQYTIKPNIYGSMAAKTIGKPVICNVSGLGTIFIHPQKVTSKIGFGLYKRAFKHPELIFFQNQDDRKLFVEMNLVQEKRTDILPGSGVDLEFFKNNEVFQRNQPFRFLMISRVLVDKGIVEFTDAAAMLKEKYGDQVEFCLLGKYDDSAGSVPQEVFDQWLESGRFKYLGTTDNVKEEIVKADCVVLPSYREGTPRTLLESLALSKPIVTTNVPGCKETVINNKNGYICEVRNTGDLAKKMEQVFHLTDEELKNMGKESRVLAENRFDENIVIKRYFQKIYGICKK